MQYMQSLILLYKPIISKFLAGNIHWLVLKVAESSLQTLWWAHRLFVHFPQWQGLLLPSFSLFSDVNLTLTLWLHVDAYFTGPSSFWFWLFFCRFLFLASFFCFCFFSWYGKLSVYFKFSNDDDTNSQSYILGYLKK